MHVRRWLLILSVLVLTVAAAPAARAAVVADAAGAAANASLTAAQLGVEPSETLLVGTVYGRGYKYVKPLSGATVSVLLSDPPINHLTDGRGLYFMSADLGLPLYYAGVELQATADPYYISQTKAVPSDQAGQFVSTNFTLEVKGTKIYGRVVSTQGRGLRRVRIACAGRTVYTNSQGRFRIGYNPSAPWQLQPLKYYTLRAAKTGFYARSVKFQSRPGGELKLANIRLRRR